MQVQSADSAAQVTTTASAAAQAVQGVQGVQGAAGDRKMPVTVQPARHGSPRDDRATDRAAQTPNPPASPSQTGLGDVTDRTGAATGPITPLTDLTGTGSDPVAVSRDTESTRVEPTRSDTARMDPPRADVARAAGTQLIEAVRHGANGSTEVALNPEELGRVRLGLTTLDGVLHVSIMAERPETQDMLRRNIGLLQTDFRALGYTDVAFDFGPGGEQRPTPPAPEPGTTAQGDGPDPATQSPTIALQTDAPRSAGTSVRLDLRL